jgi:hypothetical protein
MGRFCLCPNTASRSAWELSIHRGVLNSVPWSKASDGDMRRFAAVALLSCTFAGAAGAECYPHCDYIQDYGPYDYTYIRPGLIAYPICDQGGNCSPYPVCVSSGRPLGRITIRLLHRQ